MENCLCDMEVWGAEPPRLASDGLGFESRSLGSQRTRKERDFDRKNAMLLRLIIES